MSVIAALFPTTQAADEAVSELRLRGIVKVYEGPCDELEAPGVEEAAGEAPRKPRLIIALGQSYGGDPGTIPSWGREMVTSGGAGWSLFESLNLDATRRTLEGTEDCTVVVVEAGENAAMVRTILETNGAEAVHPALPSPR